MSVARLSEYSNLDGVESSIGSRVLMVGSKNDYIQFAYYDLDPGSYTNSNNFFSTYSIL
jgi:hypothetical protein